jgi:NAD+ synthase
MTVQDLHSRTEIKILDIRHQLQEYLSIHKLESLVIGLSGGIDSALVAALAFPICKEVGVKLLGYILPIESNKVDETMRGLATGIHFTTNGGELVNLEHIYRTIQSDKNFVFDKIRAGNIKARTRMIFLYDKASQHHGCVLSTDNYTEYLLGFWTIFGDCGDISPIQMYYKTEVYNMAKYIVDNEPLHQDAKRVLEQTIDATPTDGLGITNSDLDQIGAPSYSLVDMILLDPSGDLSDEYPKVMERSFKTTFKRNVPFFFQRI